MSQISAPCHPRQLISQQNLCLFLRICFLQSSKKNVQLVSSCHNKFNKQLRQHWFVLQMCSRCSQCHNLVSIFQRWLVSVWTILYANEVLDHSVPLLCASAPSLPPTPPPPSPTPLCLSRLSDKHCLLAINPGGSPDRRPNKALHFLPVWWVCQGPKGSEIT